MDELAEKFSKLATPPGIHSMPHHLIEHVVSHLNVSEAQSFREAASTNSACKHIVSECERRLSPFRYLSEHFSNAAEIMECMSESYTFLSGSRALDFFVPGSCSDDSDWDFYCPDTEFACSKFIDGMEKAGVVWTDTVTRFKEVFSSTKGRFTMACIGREMGEMEKALQEKCDENGMRADIAAYSDRDYTSHTPCQFVVNNYTSHVRAEWFEGTEYDMFSCFHGMLYQKGRVHKIQLMVRFGFGRPSLDIVLGFHYSPVQCIVGAHVAAHLYWEETKGMQMLNWNEDTWSLASEEGSSKYMRRGYKHVPRQSRPQTEAHRDTEDDRCIVLPTYNFTDAPEERVAAYSFLLGYAEWTERSGGDYGYHILSPSVCDSSFDADALWHEIEEKEEPATHSLCSFVFDIRYRMEMSRTNMEYNDEV